jgi:hypothetical protein
LPPFSVCMPLHGLHITDKEYLSEAYCQGSDHLCIQSEARDMYICKLIWPRALFWRSHMTVAWHIDMWSTSAEYIQTRTRKYDLEISQPPIHLFLISPPQVHMPSCSLSLPPTPPNHCVTLPITAKWKNFYWNRFSMPKLNKTWQNIIASVQTFKSGIIDIYKEMNS